MAVDKYFYLQPTPWKKTPLHQDFGKAQLTALVLSILSYFITGKQGCSC